MRQSSSVGVRLAKEGREARASPSSVFFLSLVSPCEIGHELRTNLLASHSLNSFQLAHRTAL